MGYFKRPVPTEAEIKAFNQRVYDMRDKLVRKAVEELITWCQMHKVKSENVDRFLDGVKLGCLAPLTTNERSRAKVEAAKRYTAAPNQVNAVMSFVGKKEEK